MNAAITMRLLLMAMMEITADEAQVNIESEYGAQISPQSILHNIKGPIFYMHNL